MKKLIGNNLIKKNPAYVIALGLSPANCGLVAPYNMVNIGSDNGLLSDDNKPLLGPMLINHQVAIW